MNAGMEASAAPLPASLVLAGTIGTASVLAYLLLRGERGASSSGRHGERSVCHEGEDFFTTVVGELDSFAPPSTDGGTEQGCRWTQTDEEVEVVVPLPEGARSKDCHCKVLERSLAVKVMGGTIVEVSCCARARCTATRATASVQPTGPAPTPPPMPVRRASSSVA